jgi:hypothetical protein
MPSMLDAQRSTIGSLAKLGEGVRANSDAKTQAGLSRGAGQSKKLINAAWTQTFPAQGATLDLDFVNDRSFVRGLGQGSSLQSVTFTRATSGTFVGGDGLLKSFSNQGALGKNLVTFPQDFDNAIWAKSAITLIPNIETAPNGTLTSDLLYPSSTGNRRGLTQSISFVASTIYTFSVYIKASGWRWVYLGVKVPSIGGAGVYFDLQTQTVGSVSSGYTGSIASAENGFIRCVITINTAVELSADGAHIYLTDNDGGIAATVNGTSGIFIWGAQLEVGSTATEYFPTNINQPRFDWASTAVLNGNLIRSSQDFTFTNWVNGGSIYSVTSNTITSPDGSMTGSTISTISSGATRMVHQTGYFASEPICFSVYLKYGNSQWINIGNNNGGITAWFDVLTGVVGTVTSGCTSSIESVGSGWYRCSITILAGYASANQIGIGIVTANSSTTNPTSANVYAWGAQFEIGSTPTTYKLTGAFPATNTPLLANPTSNGLLIEEARTNRILWCRDATQIGTNLVNYSEQFDNAFWAKTGILAFGSGSVANTTATTDPLGGNTADLVVENALLDFHTIGSTTGFPVTAVNGVYVASIYIKRPLVNGRRYFQITFSAGAFGNVQYATFDLQTGLLSGSANTVGTPVMTDVGDGWYRCSMAATATSTASSLVFFVLTNAATGRSPSYLGDGVSGVYMWGAQVQETYLSNYVATITAPIIGWRNTNITVAKNQTGIDGVANACSSLTATSANGTCIQTINLVSGVRTASVYLKRITGTGNIQVTLDGITFSTVELSTTEWRRIVLSGTVIIPTVGVRIATSGDAVAMDFGQVEDGAFVTSPIMTTSAAGGVTRSADAASMTGNNFDGWMSEFGTITGNHLYFYTGDAGETSASSIGAPCGFGTAVITNQFQPIVLQNTTTRTRQAASYYRNPALAITVNDTVDNVYLGNVFLSWAVRIQYASYGLSTNFSNETTSTVINTATIKSRFVIGGNNAQTGFNGYIKYLRFFPTPKNANSLQALSGQST